MKQFMIEIVNINSFRKSKNNFCLIKRESSNRKKWTMKKMSFSGKYIAKIFNLNRFLVSECILKLIFFVRVVRNQNQDVFHVSVFPGKHLNRLVLTWFIFASF